MKICATGTYSSGVRSLVYAALFWGVLPFFIAITHAQSARTPTDPNHSPTSPSQQPPAVFPIEWHAVQLQAASWPDDIVIEQRQLAPNGLSDGLVATQASGNDIVSAWYETPTTRYDHGILGDHIEATTLRVKLASGATLAVTLPDTEVFEDRYPRLTDLNNDGASEVVTIRSSLTAGAAVTVYGMVTKQLQQIATTDFIGLSHRWLNIAAIAAFRGTGNAQIAYVQTPHIGGTLFFVELHNGKLQPVGQLSGFSNHVIGSREMRLSTVIDVDNDGQLELALPSADRRSLRIVGFKKDRLVEIASVPMPGRIDKAIGTEKTANGATFVVGLDTGSVYAVKPKH